MRRDWGVNDEEPCWTKTEKFGVSVRGERWDKLWWLRWPRRRMTKRRFETKPGAKGSASIFEEELEFRRRASVQSLAVI